jgi:uncharacterized protein (TIGR03067 family)
MRTWLIVSAVLVVAFAPAPLPRRERGIDNPEAQLTGTWRIKTIRWRGGESYDASAFAGYVVNKSDRVVITRGRISFQTDGGQGERTATFQLSGAGEVRHVDFTTDGKAGQPMRGLYALRGGALHLSFNYSYGPRPTQLSGDGDEIAFILERR